MAPVELVAHVLGDLVEGDVAGPLVHDLHVLGPGPLGELPLGLELGELGLVVGVVDAARAEAVADGEGDVVLGADVEDVVPVLVGEVLLVVEDVPLGVDGAAAGDDAGLAVDGRGDVTEEDAGVDGEVCSPREGGGRTRVGCESGHQAEVVCGKHPNLPQKDF